MSCKPKTMCKWDKDRISEDFDKFVKLVKKPGYACRKCGRVASTEKRLCKPVALK
jgi:hypothetical protein